MDCKIQAKRNHRSKSLENPDEAAPMQSKSKENSKNISQLWNSLFKVYEKEANKENAPEDLSCLEFEEWSANSSLYMPSFLPRVDSRVISKAFLGSEKSKKVNSLKSKSYKKQLHVKKKRRCEESNESISFQAKVKSKKKSSAKNNLKGKPHFQTPVKSKEKKKNNFVDSSTKEDLIDENSKKRRNCTKNHVLIENKKSNLRHECKLKLKHYSTTERLPKRSDGRVFRCQLIFKICECFESEERF